MARNKKNAKNKDLEELPHNSKVVSINLQRLLFSRLSYSDVIIKWLIFIMYVFINASCLVPHS